MPLGSFNSGRDLQTLVGPDLLGQDRKAQTVLRPDSISALAIEGQVAIGGSGADAFGRARTSESETVFSYVPRTGLQTDLLWDHDLSGSATITLDTVGTTVNLNTTTASGDKAVRATYRHFIYTPGKSNLLIFSCNFGGNETNVRKRIGQFDSKSGWFYELNGSDLRCVIRSSVSGSVVDTAVSQSSWNQDKLDGTGPSGLTLDTTQILLPTIDYQWLGAGRVRFGFIIHGRFIYTHYFDHANLQPTLYLDHPHLPLRAEIENLATLSGGSTFKVTCFSIAVEGGGVPTGVVAPFSSETTEVSIASSETYLYSVSLLPAFYRQAILPVDLQFLSTSGTKAVIIRIYFNSDLTSPTWNNLGDISRVDEDASAFSGGRLVGEFYLSVGGSNKLNPTTDLNLDLNLGSRLDETPNNFTVTAQTLGGTGKIVYGVAVREFV